jgi:hypothetical protein
MPEAAHETKLLPVVTACDQFATGAAVTPRVIVSPISSPRIQTTKSGDIRQRPRARIRNLPTLLVIWLLVASACSAPPAPSAPLFGTGVLHPPPKPGDSISHTQMCECKVCDPDNCCDGPDDDAPKTDCSHVDSYDFTANAACGGLAVRSCASRCTREIWRVHAGTSCADKRPESCCRAG